VASIFRQAVRFWRQCQCSINHLTSPCCQLIDNVASKHRASTPRVCSMRSSAKHEAASICSSEHCGQQLLLLLLLLTRSAALCRNLP
jgi:hypothetical protein